MADFRCCLVILPIESAYFNCCAEVHPNSDWDINKSNFLSKKRIKILKLQTKIHRLDILGGVKLTQKVFKSTSIHRWKV